MGQYNYGGNDDYGDEYDYDGDGYGGFGGDSGGGNYSPRSPRGGGGYSGRGGGFGSGSSRHNSHRYQPNISPRGEGGPSSGGGGFHDGRRDSYGTASGSHRHTSSGYYPQQYSPPPGGGHYQQQQQQQQQYPQDYPQQYPHHYQQQHQPDTPRSRSREEDDMDVAMLLSQQESEFGINMVDAITPADEPEIDRLMRQGYSRNEALRIIFNYRYPSRNGGGNREHNLVSNGSFNSDPRLVGQFYISA